MVDLERLKRLEAAATPGDWEAGPDHSDPRPRGDYLVQSRECVIIRQSRPWFWNDPPRRDEADFALIVALRNAARAIIAEIEELRRDKVMAEAKLNTVRYILANRTNCGMMCKPLQGTPDGCPRCDMFAAIDAAMPQPAPEVKP